MPNFKELFTEAATPDDQAFKTVIKFLGYKLPGRVKDGMYMSKTEKGRNAVNEIIAKDFVSGSRRFASRNGWTGEIEAAFELMSGTVSMKIKTLTSPDGEAYVSGSRWNMYKDFTNIKLQG